MNNKSPVSHSTPPQVSESNQSRLSVCESTSPQRGKIVKSCEYLTDYFLIN